MGCAAAIDFCHRILDPLIESGELRYFRRPLPPYTGESFFYRLYIYKLTRRNCAIPDANCHPAIK